MTAPPDQLPFRPPPQPAGTAPPSLNRTLSTRLSSPDDDTPGHEYPMSTDARNTGRTTTQTRGATAALERLTVAARVAALRPASPVEVVGVPLPVQPLRTARLTFRPLAASDRTEFLRVHAISREHLRRFCPLGDPMRIEQSDEQVFSRQLDFAIGAQATGRAWRMMAFDAQNRLVGGFNINDISRGLEHSGELVFWISADQIGRGLAAEAGRAVLEHAFTDMPRGLGLHKVTALIAPDNTPCRGLVRTLGLSRATAPVVELIIGGERVKHDVFDRFAPVSGPIGSPVVESKPSVDQQVFGTGLLRILRTEENQRRSA